MCFIAAGVCDGTIIHTFFPPSHLLPPSDCKLNHTYCFLNIIDHVSAMCFIAAGCCDGTIILSAITLIASIRM